MLPGLGAFLGLELKIVFSTLSSSNQSSIGSLVSASLEFSSAVCPLCGSGCNKKKVCIRIFVLSLSSLYIQSSIFSAKSVYNLFEFLR
jgi:hypothetical protein